MKKLLLFSLLAMIFTIGFTDDANAQRRGKKKKKKTTRTDEYFDESGGFKHRLWYGGGVNLSFFSDRLGNSNYTGNAFIAGLSPMVGYEVVKNLSVGPRFEFSFFNGKYQQFGQGEVLKVNVFNYGIGPFARYKILNNFFAHSEFLYQSYEEGTGFIVNNELETVRAGREYFYIGGGYTSGDIWAYEIYLLYDLLDQGNTTDLPITLRFGITHKF